jgi:hypothetical protein
MPACQADQIQLHESGCLSKNSKNAVKNLSFFSIGRAPSCGHDLLGGVKRAWTGCIGGLALKKCTSRAFAAGNISREFHLIDFGGISLVAKGDGLGVGFRKKNGNGGRRLCDNG